MVVEFATSGIFSGYRRQSLSWPQEVAVGENEENVGGGGGGGSEPGTPSTFQQNRRRENSLC